MKKPVVLRELYNKGYLTADEYYRLRVKNIREFCDNLQTRINNAQKNYEMSKLQQR